LVGWVGLGGEWVGCGGGRGVCVCGILNTKK